MTLFVNVLQPLDFVEPFGHTGEFHPPGGIRLIERVRHRERVAGRVVLPQQSCAVSRESATFGAIRSVHTCSYAAGW
jgi:hypothetical protein